MLALILFKTLLIGVTAQNLDCDCERVYSFEKQTLANFQVTVVQNVFRDFCDPNCVDQCSRLIRKDLGGLEDTISERGLEKICRDVTPHKSLPKDGTQVINRWNLNDCTKGDLLLIDNVCCRFCDCKFAFFGKI